MNVVKLVNRTDKPFAFVFNGIGYVVPPTVGSTVGFLNVTEECAHHARKKSIMLYNLVEGTAEYQVGIEGIHDTGFLGSAKGPEDELIDRKSDPAGKPVKMEVRGGKVRREDEDALRK